VATLAICLICYAVTGDPASTRRKEICTMSMQLSVGLQSEFAAHFLPTWELVCHFGYS